MEFTKENGRIFYESAEGKLLAEITYRETENGVFCIDHTFTDESLRGQGVAGALVEAAVNEITAKGGKVTATCSYAKHWLEKHGM